jgi:biotin operon repressor
MPSDQNNHIVAVAEVAELLSKRERLATQAEIAAGFGCSQATVSRALSSLNKAGVGCFSEGQGYSSLSPSVACSEPRSAQADLMDSVTGKMLTFVRGQHPSDPVNRPKWSGWCTDQECDCECHA